MGNKNDYRNCEYEMMTNVYLKTLIHDCTGSFCGMTVNVHLIIRKGQLI